MESVNWQIVITLTIAVLGALFYVANKNIEFFDKLSNYIFGIGLFCYAIFISVVASRNIAIDEVLELKPSDKLTEKITSLKVGDWVDIISLLPIALMLLLWFISWVAKNTNGKS